MGMNLQDISQNLLLGIVTNGLYDEFKQYIAAWNERPERVATDLKNMDLERSLMRSFLLAQIAVINATLALPGLAFRDKRILKQWKPAFVAFASGLDHMEFPAPPIRKIEELLHVLQHRVRPAADLELINESLLMQAHDLFPAAPECYLGLLEQQLLPQFLHFFERELKEGKKVKELLDVQMQSEQLYRQEEVFARLGTLQQAVTTLSERALSAHSLDAASLQLIQEGVRAEVARETDALRTDLLAGHNRLEAAILALGQQAHTEHEVIIQLLLELAKRLDGLAPVKPEAGPITMAFPAIPPHFAGRGALLERIHEVLAGLPGLKAVHLYGLGGMGKTTLAAAYVQRFRAEFTHRLWFDLETTQRRTFRTSSLRPVCMNRR
jgi:hypothetical protein